MKVHTQLGPGLLESAYQACLAYELKKRGLDVQTQVALPVTYDEVRIDCGYRVDLLVDPSPSLARLGVLGGPEPV